VARIVVPPLRERPEDIAPIARHLLFELAATSSVALPVLSADALAVLERYSWPGNVRELRNVVEIALVTSSGGSIQAADLPPHIRSRAIGDQALGDERSILVRALSRAGGNKSIAAKSLQCSRMTLYRKLARCGLDVHDAYPA